MIHVLKAIASTRPPSAVSNEKVRSLRILARFGTIVWLSKVVAERYRVYLVDSVDLPCEIPPFIQRRTEASREEIHQTYGMECSIRVERRSEHFRERIGSALLFDAFC
jgi:hypothetical protein